MARLIEVDGPFSDQINLQKGDLLEFTASGGRVITGGKVLESLGPFFPGILTSAGEIISPQGSPDKMMFLAIQPGVADIELFQGDSWSTPKNYTVQLQLLNNTALHTATH